MHQLASQLKNKNPNIATYDIRKFDETKLKNKKSKYNFHHFYIFHLQIDPLKHLKDKSFFLLCGNLSD